MSSVLSSGLGTLRRLEGGRRRRTAASCGPAQPLPVLFVVSVGTDVMRTTLSRGPTTRVLVCHAVVSSRFACPTAVIPDTTFQSLSRRSGAATRRSSA